MITLVKKLFLVAANVLTLCFVVGCSAKKEVRLEYVVPDSYTGILKLQGKAPDGIELRTNDGKIILNFHKSGILRIKGNLPTLDWHTEQAKYQNGTDIPVTGPSVVVPDNDIALRGLGLFHTNTEAWYFVGKTDQMKPVLKEIYGFERAH